jgi:putative transposase
MTGVARALTTISEAERALAMERFSLLRPALEEGVSQAEVARRHELPLRTIQRWMSQYRQHGLVGLAHDMRNEFTETFQPVFRCVC